MVSDDDKTVAIVAGNPSSPAYVEFVRAQFESTRTEISWRGVQRDALVLITLAVCGALLGVGDGAMDDPVLILYLWGVAAPLLILFLASRWLQHDRRIGRLAQYLREVLEPAMKLVTQHMGLEEFLNTQESDRSYRTPFHFSSALMRSFFPSLQVVMVVAGIYQYLRLPSEDQPGIVHALVAIGVGLMASVVTLAKVKHVRP